MPDDDRGDPLAEDPHRRPARLRLSVQHSLRVQATGALTLYGLYELARGRVGADSTQLGNGRGGHNGCLVLGRG
jgi:hypothetical protein